jgi:hypothetical protein
MEARALQLASLAECKRERTSKQYFFDVVLSQ